MIRQAVLGRAAALAFLLAGATFSLPAAAQDVPPEHLKAAKDVIAALSATERFDAILPSLAERLKSEYILASPNYQDQISKTVDAEALALAPRRADLEKEVATIFAKSFTADELKQIAAFYSSEVGKKYLKTLPLVQRDTLKAADIWANGISRDLTNQSTQKLRGIIDTAKIPAADAQAPANPAPAQAAAPAKPAAPAAKPAAPAAKPAPKP
ncbi:DUF2059 domain-containing protein [Rhizobium oryzicola]|uniref:DUF2059 domain-containing protein n=1 Tax=Rhizobium oryzicola TaxID=1232668 RepID=A0ABT8T210_9HYPH|nr:DUF2059 domain-containing protein [Rhizobium oryzicola]MDO1584570.1 DUF2059 domain-containing protein [Rhizobium oryzicola]